MITAALQLASFGFSMADAHTWVFAHLDNPALIEQVAGQYGITNGMLAEIAGNDITQQQVVQFFASQGINSASLDANETRLALAPNAMTALPSLLSLNDNEGSLATEALRAEVQAKTGKLQYWELFSPNRLAGAQDGVLSPLELGTSALGTLKATPQTIESLFYGTMIKMLGFVDGGELADIQALAAKSATEIETGDKAAVAAYELLVNTALQDAAAKPLDGQTIHGVLVDAAVDAIDLVGTIHSYMELLVPLLNFDI
jgi:hypothetical protein